MNTCYLAAGPILLPFHCSDEVWWAWFIGATIVVFCAIIFNAVK